MALPVPLSRFASRVGGGSAFYVGRFALMRFEKPSMDECKELIGRLRGKSADEIIGIFGQPARETGARKEERLADGVPWVVEIRRTLTYFDIGPTKAEHHDHGETVADAGLEIGGTERRALCESGHGV